jgi:arylsulfatase A-like enzyme
VWDPDLNTQSWSPLYRKIVEVPLLMRMPGAAPRRTEALTTLVDVPATILDVAGVEPPEDIAGRSLAPLLRGETDTHRDLVVSGWPLEYQKGRITIAVDSWPRRVAHDQPITVTGHGLSLIVGGPDDDLELYDLEADPGELRNVAQDRPDETIAFLEEALAELVSLGTAEELLAPRRTSLERFRAATGSTAER